MKIIVQPLTAEDKKFIRRTFIGRFVVFFIFILPILIAGLFIIYDVLSDFLHHNYSLLSFVGLIFIAVMAYFFVPYFVPLYWDTYRNLRAREKQVIETRIINKDERWTRKGLRYFIETEFTVIDSWKNTVLTLGVIFPGLQIGDLITIHVIPNNKYDILKIEKH